ncbi:MAG TPA: universal stress protein [Chloroflexota bacterium]
MLAWTPTPTTLAGAADYVAQAWDRVDWVAEEVRRAGAAAFGEVLVGTVATTIAAYAEGCDAALIVMAGPTAHARPRALDSVAGVVLACATRPVLLVPPAAGVGQHAAVAEQPPEAEPVEPPRDPERHAQAARRRGAA